MLNCQQIDYLHPEEHPWDLEAIAMSLSRQQRYLGRTKRPFSVLQHSLFCAHVGEHLGGAGLSYECLMHDAHESVVYDINSSLKKLLPDYVELEKKWEQAMRNYFGLPADASPLVEEIDKRIAPAYEVCGIMSPEHWPSFLHPEEYGQEEYEADFQTFLHLNETRAIDGFVYMAATLGKETCSA